MFERLIFPTLVEQEAGKQLLTSNWPGCTLTNLGMDEGNYIVELHLNVAEKVFFKWAYNCQARDNGILVYCYHLSLELLDPPIWMIEVLRELREQRLLRE
jgi:hypothetical protein